jgi:phage terminase large subunit
MRSSQLSSGSSSSPQRYKVAYGGRGGTKSWGFARALLILGAQRTLRILCTRETQRSIQESVYTILCDQISNLGLSGFYEIKKTEITGRNGSRFAFEGIRQNISNIKSFEGFDIVWVEEAQNVSKHSWDTLIPTIRKDGSEVWVGFNPDLESDETYQRFVVHSDALPTRKGETAVDAVVVKVNYQDNPFFPETLRAEMEACRKRSEDDYRHIYEGYCKQVVEGAIYKQQIVQAENDGRFCSVPYDAVKTVDTFWDLGFSDAVSIWLVQTVGFEFHLIDFIQGCQQDIGYYLKQLQDRPYIYGKHYLPHDARARVLAAGGRSIEQQIAATGRRVEIVPNISVEDGIAAVRAIFNRCWFDKTKCADGLQALRHYRYAVDDALSVGEQKVFKRSPLHDWASHPSDAFRMLAVAIEEPKQKPRPQAFEQGGSTLGWLG